MQRQRRPRPADSPLSEGLPAAVPLVPQSGVPEPRPELLFNYEKCLGCGRCAEVCSCHILENGVHRIRRDQCAACGKCTGVCPVDALEIKGRECTAEEVLDELRKDKKFYEKSHGGVTVSGGEPLMQPEFLREVLEKCRREGIHTALETSGCASRQVLAGVPAPGGPVSLGL